MDTSSGASRCVCVVALGTALALLCLLTLAAMESPRKGGGSCGGDAMRRYSSPREVLQGNVPPPAPAPPSPPEPLVAPVYGGAPYEGATDTSDLFQEHERVFKPMTLSQTMPLGWRKPCGSFEPQFSEFSHFVVTPEKYEGARNLLGAFRLPQSTRTGLTRTLGATDLLREKLAPLTMPVGRTSMPFLDSQARQNYMAEATGSLPQNC